MDLAYSAGEQGSTFPAVLNAANEVAVMAFLEGKIRLTAIPEIVESTLADAPAGDVVSEVTLGRADTWASARRRGDRDPPEVRTATPVRLAAH